jgi:hypothetical protein
MKCPQHNTSTHLSRGHCQCDRYYTILPFRVISTARGRAYAGWTIREYPSGAHANPMDNGGRLAGSRRWVLRLVVLAPSAMARLSRRNSGRGRLAMTGGGSVLLGFAIALRCVWDFGWTGRGTPAPVAPPKRVVVVGFYRHVRNPMYVGFAAGWIGLWIVFGHPNQDPVQDKVFRCKINRFGSCQIR